MVLALIYMHTIETRELGISRRQEPTFDQLYRQEPRTKIEPLTNLWREEGSFVAAVWITHSYT